MDSRERDTTFLGRIVEKPQTTFARVLFEIPLLPELGYGGIPAASSGGKALALAADFKERVHQCARRLPLELINIDYILDCACLTYSSARSANALQNRHPIWDL